MAFVRSALEAYPRPFWALVVGTFVNRTGLVVLPFLALFLTAERGYSVPMATLAVSLYGAGSFLGGLAGGWLSDAVGRRPVLLVSLGGAAVPVAAIPFAPTFATVAAAAFAFGFLAEMYRPAVSAVVADLLPEERRARGYALVYWAINLGAAVGPALGGWLASRSYTGLFVLEGVTLMGYAALVAVEDPGDTSRRCQRVGRARPSPGRSGRSPCRDCRRGAARRNRVRPAVFDAAYRDGCGWTLRTRLRTWWSPSTAS